MAEQFLAIVDADKTLYLVAKIIGDHGGVIECDSVPRRTVFRILLPKAITEENTNA